jgi:hypothetical protein
MKTLALALFVALALPQLALAQATQGGSTQVAAQEGCMNEWMFNGVWRVRVTQLAFKPQDNDGPAAWTVAMQWANGTSIAGLSPADTRKQDMNLVFSNGDTLATSESTRATMNQQLLDFHTFPAAAQFSFTQQFISSSPLDPNNKPQRILITFDVATYKKQHPTDAKFWTLKTPAYNYRISFGCTK